MDNRLFKLQMIKQVYTKDNPLYPRSLYAQEVLEFISSITRLLSVYIQYEVCGVEEYVFQYTEFPGVRRSYPACKVRLPDGTCIDFRPVGTNVLGAWGRVDVLHGGVHHMLIRDQEGWKVRWCGSREVGPLPKDWFLEVLDGVLDMYDYEMLKAELSDA